MTNKILLMALALVVAFAPIQYAFASVSDCMILNQHEQHQMTSVDHMDEASQHSKTMSKHTCPDNHCNNGGCTAGHCAGASMVAVPASPDLQIAYAVMELVNPVSTELFTNHPTTLFRPPRS